MNRVNNEIDGSEAAGEEGAPLPVVVLSTQMEVTEQDGGLRAGDDEDNEDEEQEAKHIVHLVGPDRV